MFFNIKSEIIYKKKILLFYLPLLLIVQINVILFTNFWIYDFKLFINLKYVKICIKNYYIIHLLILFSKKIWYSFPNNSNFDNYHIIDSKNFHKFNLYDNLRH